MKTEPTEALKNLIREVFDAYDSDGRDIENVVEYESAKKAVRSAFEEGKSNLIVKQLEWAEGFFALLSDTPFGIYQILKPAGTHSAHIIYLNDKPILIVSDLNEAKSAAQADFEKRIKECLL